MIFAKILPLCLSANIDYGFFIGKKFSPRSIKNKKKFSTFDKVVYYSHTRGKKSKTSSWEYKKRKNENNFVNEDNLKNNMNVFSLTEKLKKKLFNALVFDWKTLNISHSVRGAAGFYLVCKLNTNWDRVLTDEDARCCINYPCRSSHNQTGRNRRQD